MKLPMLLALGASALVASTGAQAATTITYTGSQVIGTIQASYSITTDGKIGALSDADITSFDVKLADSISSVNYGRTSASGTGSASGNFTATATDLSIGSFFSLSLYTNATGPSGGLLGSIKFANIVTPSTSAQIDDAAHGAGLSLSAAEPNNRSFASVSAVPEPASWAMMIAGVGLLGTAMRRPRRVSTRFA